MITTNDIKLTIDGLNDVQRDVLDRILKANIGEWMFQIIKLNEERLNKQKKDDASFISKFGHLKDYKKMTAEERIEDFNYSCNAEVLVK